MYINSVDNTTFQAKNFRLPIKFCDYDRAGSSLINYRNIPGKWVLEYSNPNAEEIYKKVCQETDATKKNRLMISMGPCRVIDVSLKARFIEWYNRVMISWFLKG